MKVELQSLISLLTFLAGAGSAVWGMLNWYATGEKKKYAAEREFQHLRRNQEQMKEQIAHIGREIDAQGDDFKTLNACFNLLLGQSGQTVSGIFANRPKSQEDAEQ